MSTMSATNLKPSTSFPRTFYSTFLQISVKSTREGQKIIFLQDDKMDTVRVEGLIGVNQGQFDPWL